MADYKWQEKALARYAKRKIVPIIAACGTGKTRALIKLALAKMLPVIIITPKNIIRDWVKELHEIAGDKIDIWVYDSAKVAKLGNAYYDEFSDWLKPKREELDAMERARKEHT